MDNRNKSQLAVIILGIVLIIAAAIFAIWVASPQKEEAAAPDASQTSATATTTPVASTPTLSETALADGTCTTAAEVDRTNPEKLIQGFLEIGYCRYSVALNRVHLHTADRPCVITIFDS